MYSLTLLLLLAQTSAPTGATLRGHVYAMDTGAPLARAQVTLYGAGLSAGRQSLPLAASTGPDGVFEFKQVAPGSYSLQAQRTGYLGRGYGQQSLTRSPTQVQVKNGEDLNDLDIRLLRGGVITGTVTDENGDPLMNAAVQLYVRRYNRGQPFSSINSANTDDRGTYRIHSIQPGRYYVRAMYSMELPAQRLRYAPSFYPNAVDFSGAQRLEIDGAANSEITQVNFSLRALRTYAYSGQVVDRRTGKPAPAGNIQIAPFDRGQEGIHSYSNIAPDGAFSLKGLFPGRYSARVTIQDPTPSQPAAETLAAGRTRINLPQPFPTQIDMGAEDVTGAVLMVGGQMGSLRGRVVAEGGDPPKGLTVNLVARSEVSPFGNFQQPVQMKPDQTFEIPEVQPGEYDFQVWGNQLGYLSAIRIAGRDVIDTGIKIAEGTSVDKIELIFDFKMGTVEGRVADSDEKPAPDKMIVMLPADAGKRESAVTAGQGRFRTGRTSPEGRYKFDRIIPGEYVMLVWPSDDFSDLLDPEVFAQVESYTQKVRVERDGKLTQDLKLAPQVETVARKLAQ